MRRREMVVTGGFAATPSPTVVALWFRAELRFGLNKGPDAAVCSGAPTVCRAHTYCRSYLQSSVPFVVRIHALA
jgi:hypothetical protein